MQVGRTVCRKGLYNKPSAVVHPGVLAAGTLPQYNTIQYLLTYLLTAIEFSLSDSSPYTSTDKTNNIHRYRP